MVSATAEQSGAARLFAGPGEMRARCRAMDWAQTPLGDVASWPVSLTTAALTVLGGGFSMIVLWGSELVQIFNDGYLTFLGAKHEHALGQPTRACWPEVWHINAPIYDRVLAGETVTLEDAHFPLQPDGPAGPVEHRYITLSYSPLPDGAGGVGGVLVTLTDTTAIVLGRAIQAERDALAAQLNGALLEAALVLDQTRDAYMLLDADFRISTINPSGERLLNCVRADVVQRPCAEAFPDASGFQIEHTLRRVAADRTDLHFVHHHVRDGGDVYLEIDAYPAAGGGVAVFWRDVSERMRLEAAAEAARVDAESRAATLTAIFQSIPDALLVGHRDGVFLANGAARHLFGVRAETVDAAGLLRDLLPYEHLLRDERTGAPLPLETTPIGAAFRGARSHGQYLLHARGSSGELLPIRAAAAPIITSNGVVTGVVTVLTDMSSVHRATAERERLLHALNVERARLAYVFQHAPAFLAILRGPTHVFELANDAYYELVGKRDLIGKPLFVALPEVRDQGFLDLIDGVLATGVPYIGREVPIRLARTPGAEPEARFVDFVYLPLVEADGARSGIIAHGTDVTEQVEARHEIERLLRESERARADADVARVEAETANRGKSDFLAVMSHELRTPLNAIGGYAQLIAMGLRGPVTEAQLSDLQRIQVSQNHLLALINRVLNFAMLDAGAVSYEVIDVPLDELLATCEALVSPQATAKQIALIFTDCDTELRARADPEKVRQVVLNLLSNALKFTDPGGSVSLSCATATRDGHDPQIAIRVTDTGRGISPDQLERIFQAFVQVDARLTRTQEGTGLGLAISRELARGMGGDLTVESTRGVGSTFTVLLPGAA